MSGQILNFTDVEGSVQNGQQYGGTGEDSLQKTKGFGSRMEGFHGANAGAANNRLAMTSLAGVQNGASLAKQFVDQAIRTVTATRDGVQGDEQAFQDGTAAFTAAEGSTTTFSRPATV